MNKNLAIKAENISKQYRLGEVGTGTLSHDLNRFWAKLRGKEDPYLKIGEANDRSRKGDSEYVWSLRDINFEIEQGDAVGIIGRNGAGKSTLLKLLSKVTKPTTGSFKVNGRIASLLEVGTGFNPEMTGRENIYLNGAILGMRKHEIDRKFDEIVDFSGVERYIDTPVKRYSSGMYVRLAFAVAAHLESEILIVDEVLAVGDAEFQKKCLGKMGDVSKGEGRTVLFVSHNMAAVQNLCNKGLMLDKGQLVADDFIENVIDFYLNNISYAPKLNFLEFDASNKDIYLSHVEVCKVESEKLIGVTEFLMSDDIVINFKVKVKKRTEGVRVSAVFFDNLGNRIFSVRSHENSNQKIIIEDEGIIRMTLSGHHLMPGQYSVTFGLGDAYETHMVVRDGIVLNIIPTDIFGTGRLPTFGNDIIFNRAKWEYIGKLEK